MTFFNSFSQLASAAEAICSKFHPGTSAAIFNRAFSMETGDKATLHINSLFHFLSKQNNPHSSVPLMTGVFSYLRLPSCNWLDKIGWENSRWKYIFLSFAHPVITRYPSTTVGETTRICDWIIRRFQLSLFAEWSKSNHNFNWPPSE